MTETLTILPIIIPEITIAPELITIFPPQPPNVRDELEEQGWNLVSVPVNGVMRNAYEGMFKGNRRVYKGFVWCDDNSVFIKDLPENAKSGHHRYCFSSTKDGWYSIHFSKGCNPIGKIAAIEEYLREVGE